MLVMRTRSFFHSAYPRAASGHLQIAIWEHLNQKMRLQIREWGAYVRGQFFHLIPKQASF